jgi:hypothetical protein
MAELNVGQTKPMNPDDEVPESVRSTLQAMRGDKKNVSDFCDDASWISLLGGIGLPLFAAVLTFSAILPDSREGARAILMLFVLAEIGAAICGLIGFAGIRKGRIFWISVRSVVGISLGSVGAFYTLMLAGFAGSRL